jgi:hypothetical protein
MMDGLIGDFYQIGVVVADIDQGIEHYRSLLGLGPFWRLDTDYEGRYRDWHGRIVNKNAFTKWGDVYLEMIQPIVGKGNAKEWLDNCGPGIFHLGYAVDDLSQRPAEAPCVFESWGAQTENGGAAVIHLDTVDQLGYFVELADRNLVVKLSQKIDAFMLENAA